MLLGGLSAGAALSGCAPAVREPRITPAGAYTNDYHIPGAGYYHAPFHAFFPHPYNYFDPERKQYYAGGQWSPAPFRSVINISEPDAMAAQAAEMARTDIVRGGFGGTSRGFHTWS
jgi:hypothetical protein